MDSIVQLWRDGEFFGTCFLIGYDQERVYAVTAAHVVDDDRFGPSEIDGRLAEILAIGDKNGIDLAVLSFPRAKGGEVIPTLALAKPVGGESVSCRGFSKMDPNIQPPRPTFRPLRGKLRDEPTRRDADNGYSYIAWDVELDERERWVVAKGYSGGPVTDQASGAVLAVIGQNNDQAKAAFAIDITELRTIWDRADEFFVEETGPTQTRSAAPRSQPGADPAAQARLTETVLALLRKLDVELNKEFAEDRYVPSRGARDESIGSDLEHAKDNISFLVAPRIRRKIGIERPEDASSARMQSVDRNTVAVWNLATALRRSRAPIVLLGEPGSGKTITLRFTAQEIAKREKKRANPKLVLYVRLGAFHVPRTEKVTIESVWDFVVRSAAASAGELAGDPAEFGNQLAELRNTGRLLVIFDGMDEMSRDRYADHTSALTDFADYHRDVQCLFACRITDFNPICRHRRYILLPFDRGQIKDMVARRLGGEEQILDGKSIKPKELARRLYEDDLPFDARNPFLIRLLCSYVQQNKRWPGSRTDLMHSYMETRFQKRMDEAPWRDLPPDRVPSFDSCEQTWAAIAYEIMIQDRGDTIELKALDWDRQAIEVGKLCGLLEEGVAADPGVLRFRHHRFSEFYAAFHIYKNPEIDASDALWISRLRAPNWQETLANLALLGGERANQALRILEGVFTNDETIKMLEAALVEAENTPEDLSEVGWKLESLQCDLVEVAAAIVRQLPRSKRVLTESPLAAAVSGTMRRLFFEGGPISQIRMLEVVARVPALAPDDMVQAGLESDLELVRDEASRLFTANEQAERVFGKNTGTEFQRLVAIDDLVRTLPRFWKHTWEKGTQKGLLLVSLLTVLAVAVLVSALGASWYTQKFLQQRLTAESEFQVRSAAPSSGQFAPPFIMEGLTVFQQKAPILKSPSSKPPDLAPGPGVRVALEWCGGLPFLFVAAALAALAMLIHPRFSSSRGGAFGMMSRAHFVLGLSPCLVMAAVVAGGYARMGGLTPQSAWFSVTDLSLASFLSALALTVGLYLTGRVATSAVILTSAAVSRTFSRATWVWAFPLRTLASLGLVFGAIAFFYVIAFLLGGLGWVLLHVPPSIPREVYLAGICSAIVDLYVLIGMATPFIRRRPKTRREQADSRALLLNLATLVAVPLVFFGAAELQVRFGAALWTFLVFETVCTIGMIGFGIWSFSRRISNRARAGLRDYSIKQERGRQLRLDPNRHFSEGSADSLREELAGQSPQLQEWLLRSLGIPQDEEMLREYQRRLHAAAPVVEKPAKNTFYKILLQVERSTHHDRK